MENVRTLIYDDKTFGRKVISFPPELPFADLRDELAAFLPTGEPRDALLGIASSGTVYEMANALAGYMATSSEPHVELLRIAALGAGSDPAGLNLLAAALLAVPPAEELVTDLVEFRSVRRLMERIVRAEKAGRPLKESEEWFKRKVLLLSTSFPLPNDASASEGAPWMSWSDGVKRAIADPDRRWDRAIKERAKVELEAIDLRVKMRLATMDTARKERASIFLYALGQETAWKMLALEGAYERWGEASLVLRDKLQGRWDDCLAALRGSEAGSRIADMFAEQAVKVHPLPQLKLGAATLRALLMHPLLTKSRRKPDHLSCLAIFVEAAGKGIVDVLLQRVPGGNALKAMVELPGFNLREKEHILSIDLQRVPPSTFLDEDGTPAEVEWTNIRAKTGISYRTLVLSYMDNDNFLAELLNNPRAISQPGVIPVIALRCRSLRILSIIANRRDLATGFSNKEVPLNLLMNPAKVSLTALRKFIHVRYVDRPTLTRLSMKGTNIREEVRREIQRYLATLN